MTYNSSFLHSKERAERIRDAIRMTVAKIKQVGAKVQ